MRPTIWIPEEAPPSVRERLGLTADVQVYPAAGAVPASLGSGDLIVGGSSPMRALEVAPRIAGLRYFQTFSAGVDRIIGHLPAGVTLCDAAGVHDIAVAEWVVMVILAAQRRLPEHVLGQHAGTWRRERLTGSDLDGATVALVGVGAIGRAVEARLLPFGVRIVRVARRAREGVRPVDELKAILAGADIVVILMPLTPETTNLFDAPTLAAMRSGALLVNASRGGIVDTDALTAA
ncbi:MAG TPA: NAD(P)-dependent oxidoreductase, partial [Candidatus Limnocylindrales bacterium]|nr:NAD(P)-dependent oxidoreductase [Candidatus Limnocylindrales bacterium]